MVLERRWAQVRYPKKGKLLLLEAPSETLEVVLRLVQRKGNEG